MNSMTPDEMNGIVSVITEAMEFLCKKDADGELKEHLYLFEDIKNGLEFLAKANSKDSTNDFIAATRGLIQNLEYVMLGNEWEFSVIQISFDNWREVVTFELAEKYFEKTDYIHATEGYVMLTAASHRELGTVAYHRLGQIHRVSDPMLAFDYYKQSFRNNNEVSKLFVAEDHPSFHYVYEEKKENYQSDCPFCHTEAQPYFCAESYRGLSYNKMYSPLKVWMHCSSCDHLFAFNNPSFLSELKFDGVNFKMMTPKLGFLPTIGDNLKQLQQYSHGNRLLDVGIGGGELLAVAKELMFDVEGLEIVEMQANHIAEMLNIKVHACDFLKYVTDKKYDLITLGDVIEHIENPSETIQKAYDLLDSNGVFWISTPNFHSAFSQFVKFEDAMWKEAGHLHYFSYTGLKYLLEQHNFAVINYKMSSHYRGSMEITAVKN